MPERSMPGRSLLVRPPGPLRPHAVIQSAWADLFAHVLSDADRADYVALLQRRRDADGPAARKAARELEREAREAGAVADAALLALEALRGQRLALYKLDANGSGFVAAEACASVCAASGGRGFVRVCDAIAALEAATRPETKEARLAEPKCGGAARRAFYALDARGEGHVRADALLAEWRAARPPVEFYEAVRAAPRDGAALRLRDFEAALETAFALARHRRLRAPATAALRAAAGALFLDQHRAQRSGDGPLEFRDQIATDARARRDRVRREAIVPLDDDEAAVIPARHVVPHAPTRVCLDVAPLRSGRLRYVNLGDVGGPAGGAPSNLELHVAALVHFQPEHGGGGMVTMVRCDGAETREVDVPLVSDAAQPPRAVVALFVPEDDKPPPIKFNCFDRHGAPVYACALVLPRRRDAADAVNVAVDLHPLVQGAPPAQLLVHVRHVACHGALDPARRPLHHANS